MKQLHASGEDYLEAILVLKRKKGMVRSVDVARHLDVSKPSVCHAVASSSNRMGLFFRMARAIESRCRSPPESRLPFSPVGVS